METLRRIIGYFDKQEFLNYLSGQVDSTLLYTISFCITLLVGITVVLLLRQGMKMYITKVTWLFLFNYVCFILSITTIFRNSSEKKPIELELFWSYNRILRGDRYLLYENIMNIVMFIPIGFLFGCMFSLSKWWVTLLIGICLSVSIELLQLGFHRGLCELDDLIHNTTGCLTGLLIAVVMKVLFNFSKSKINSCCQVQQ